MPTLAGAAQVQVVWNHRSGLPQDDIVNTLAFDVSGKGSFGSWGPELAELVESAFTTASGTNGGLTGHMAECLSGLGTINVYDLSEAQPRTPYPSAWGFSPTGTSANYPNEVACCLSFKTSPGNVDPTRRGRIFVGPLNGAASGAEDAFGNAVPSPGLITALLSLGTKLHDLGDTHGMPWSIWSRKTNSLGHILAIWVDQAFDTQRRRGNAPLGRQSGVFT